MPELPVVSQPPHRSAALLDHLTRRMRVRSEAALEPLGLRPRHLLTLTVLRDLAGSGQQDLAETLHIDRTNLVGLLNELEDRDLVRRLRSTRDRRRHVVELTAAGHEQLAEAEFVLAAAEDEVLRALTTAERESLYQLLVRASAGLTTSTAVREALGEIQSPTTPRTGR